MVIANRSKSKEFQNFEVPPGLKRLYIDCLNDALYWSCSMRELADITKDPECVKKVFKKAVSHAVRQNSFQAYVRDFIDYFAQNEIKEFKKEFKKEWDNPEVEGVQITLFDCLKEKAA